MTPTPDPSPVVTPFRIFLLLSFLLSTFMMLDAVPVEVKFWLNIGLIVVTGILTIIFGTVSNPSIVSRIRARFSKAK